MHKVLHALHKLAYDAYADIRKLVMDYAKSPAEVLKQSIAQGAASPIQVAAGDRVRLPGRSGELAAHIFNPSLKNRAVTERTERLVQQNRARDLGVTYKPDVVYPLSVQKAGYGAVVKMPNELPSDANEYHVVQKDPYESGGRAYAPYVFRLDNGRNYIEPGRLSYHSQAGTLLHESNHFFTKNGGRGTNQPGVAINPYFFYGDRGSSTSGVIDRVRWAVKNNQPISKDQVSRYNAANKVVSDNFFGYPVEHTPNSYYNSYQEFLTAARSTRERLGDTKGIPTVGIRPDLRHDPLPNGTLPFNAAGVKAGLWTENPKYRAIPEKRQRAIEVNNAASPDWFTTISNATGIPDFRRKDRLKNAARATDTLAAAVKDESKHGYQVRYKPTPNADLTGDSIDTHTKNWVNAIDYNNRESQELLKHINFMQYLIDLGPRRNAQQTQLLQTLQMRLPFFFSRASNNRAPQNSRAVPA